MKATPAEMDHLAMSSGVFVVFQLSINFGLPAGVGYMISVKITCSGQTLDVKELDQRLNL